MYGQSRGITIIKPPAPLIPATVTKVVDGDTIEAQLAGGTMETICREARYSPLARRGR